MNTASQPVTPSDLQGSDPNGSAPNMDEDIVGFIPRYAIPNISSMLPTYTNSEQDFINRTFATGNYDFIRHLPLDIKYQTVVAARTERMEAARKYLMPAISGPLLKSRPDNQQGLFSTFEYQPTQFNIADELASKQRVESEAKRLAIAGKEFVPAAACPMGKHQELTKGKLYPHLGGPHEAKEETRQAYRALEEAKQIGPDFIPAGTQKLAEKPTRAIAWEMMNNLRKWILQDWEGADVAIFENHQDHWVVRISLDSIDSLAGMRAYMNVFVRCNELVLSYKMTKVPEFWHTTPDDGGVYYVLRPPWVPLDALQTFYTIAPLERHWSTSHAVQELSSSRRVQGDKLSDDEDDELKAEGAKRTPLGYVSRLEWGRNFLTGTVSAAALGKGIP